MIVAVLAILFFIAYGILILYFNHKWKNIPLQKDENLFPGLKFSIIIPARNEEKTIARLLSALQSQEYPAENFEIIVVNDDSDDATAAIASSFDGVTLLHKTGEILNSHKKRALELGIAQAKYEYIVTTDADCMPPPTWLRSLSIRFAQTHSVMVVAPVVIDCNSSSVQLFQAIDFMVLQGITGAAIEGRLMSMCNGANLAYKKSVFEEVNGFKGIDAIASGDDMLLLHKVWQKYPTGISYLKSTRAIVSTAAMNSWGAFFQQRVRWASKSLVYEDKRITMVLLLVYLFNLSFFALAILGFAEYRNWVVLVGLLVLKTIIEFPFFHSVAVFFNKQWSLKYFPLFQPMHIAYTVISGLFSQFGKYNWKGRMVR